MRALAISLLAGTLLLAGCNNRIQNPNDRVQERSGVNLPDSLKFRSVHMGQEAGWRFVTVSVDGGSTYTQYSPVDTVLPAAATGGFYRYNYLTEPTRPGAGYYGGYAFRPNARNAALVRNTVQFDGQSDATMIFNGESPDGRGNNVRVTQSLNTFWSGALTPAQLAGNYSGTLTGPDGVRQDLTLTIDPEGNIRSNVCAITGRAERYQNARAARVTLQFPADQNCRIMEARDVRGILLLGERDVQPTVLMADYRTGNRANGFYGEFAR